MCIENDLLSAAGLLVRAEIAKEQLLRATAVALGPIAAFLRSDRRATAVTYAASLIVTGMLAAIGVAVLIGGASSATALPLGPPWIGAHTTHFTILSSYGLHFVASPRHADVLRVTGPITMNMREALMRVSNPTPDPKWVAAVGDCAASGGLFTGSCAVAGGVKEVVPVDRRIEGCPPSPRELLSALMTLLGEIG